MATIGIEPDLTEEINGEKEMKAVLVPTFMFVSSCLMALAWLGHLRFRDSIGFWTALGASWLLVLPEYVLNVAATRYGYGAYSGAQMASFHLAFGVVCVALVSRFVLREHLGVSQMIGFVMLAVAIVLITRRP
jgi:uncharacterized protein (DUF486 family)